VPDLSREQLDDLKHAVDLRDEIERDLGPASVLASGASTAPLSRGQNPQFRRVGRCLHRFCHRPARDILTWLQDYRGLGFREALGWLIERVQGTLGSYFPRFKPAPAAPATASLDAPSAIWQQLALHELEQAEVCLWSKVGAKALAYLRTVRGLDDETIRRFR